MLILEDDEGVSLYSSKEKSPTIQYIRNDKHYSDDDTKKYFSADPKKTLYEQLEKTAAEANQKPQ